MSWNYRITRHTDEALNIVLFQVREVFYNDLGLITGWSSEPAAPFGEDAAELISDIAALCEAVNKPVIDLDTGVPLEVAPPISSTQ